MYAIFLLTLVAFASANEMYQKQLLDGTVRFTSKMYTEVVRSNPSKSVVLSAFSVLPPLAQLSLAAVGESHDELLNAIGLRNDNVTRAVFPEVTQELQSVKGVSLKLANKMYIHQAYQLNKQFGIDIKQVFNAEVKNIDFTQTTEAAREINQWVESQTDNHIKDLIDPDSLSADTGAVLVNAVYFKGSWKSKFDRAMTADRDFHVSADKTIKVPTMHKIGSFRYGENTELNAKLLEIPYQGDDASFLIVLPNDIEGLSAIEEKVKDNPALLIEASKQMLYTRVDVFLPKFKIETTINLKQVLQKIGVTKIFDAKSARLDHLISTDKPLFVSEAIQKAFIEINEEGAEAAAANAVMLLFKSARTLEFRFVADRPFLFGLKIKSPKTLLFCGSFKG